MATDRQRYANEPMTREDAVNLCIAFWEDTGLPCGHQSNGAGFDALVPMEYIRGLLEVTGRWPRVIDDRD